MAKIVLAGSADCPYYAKCELLADTLQKNLPDFKLHKIVIQPAEWKNWLANTCNKRGWHHTQSPIIWRELVDRGGKGMLIGGANDFQEYANGYYGVKSKFTSDDMRKIGDENKQTKIEIDEEEREFKSRSKPIHVCITNAGSPVCYNMIQPIASGEVFGPGTEISLRLYDSEENLSQLEGVEMEAFDLACPLLRNITVTANIHQAFSDCSAVVLLDELNKGEEESKEDWLKRNNDLFVDYAKVLDDVAKRDVKVLVAGNGPINFNVCMMLKHVQNIPRQNIVGLSRMVENQAKGILAERLKVNSAGIVDVIVWGNMNGTVYTDVDKVRIHGYDGAIWGPPSYSVPGKDMVHDEKWLETEFLELLAARRGTIENELRHSSAVSQAAATASTFQHWWNGSPQGQFFSLTVASEGWYEIPEGMVFSYPVTFSTPGYWNIMQDIDLSDEEKEKLQNIVKEIRREIEVIYPPPYQPPPTPPTEPEVPPDDTTDVNLSSTAEDADGNSNNSAAPVVSDLDDDKPVLAKIEEDRDGEEEAAKETDKITEQEE